MYGIVNKSIEDLVVANFGQDKWDAIHLRSGVDIDFFLSNEIYDDDVTYKIATAVSEEMDMSLNDVLVTFGEWWVMRTTKDKYPGLLESGGNNLRDFLVNLPNFHNRVMLIYPKLSPPEFKVTDVEEAGLHLHYFSKREGLQDFVRGILQGLGQLYNAPVTLELLQSRNEGSSHEIFKINW
ncbi:heme NO-binding domain-containing protein [Flavobacterium algicola]|uniref:heme NO-binding domain-containing protein n=1 Tax=Flavobacterium algicola TaxID=556529 RepID=UPI001EFE321B|nr:heme NO-binding domain-containing protein [Flavobacterium algicola]MCG9791627.1 heme NO-binding domain-containing protein [Flavobacterium algicola]